jgi:hypothetical protein
VTCLVVCVSDDEAVEAVRVLVALALRLRSVVLAVLVTLSGVLFGVVMRSPGLRIAVRVAGSWIAAAGLLTLGLLAKG